MHFHAGQPFQMYSSHENTPVCKFAENGKKVKPANFFCILGPLLKAKFKKKLKFEVN